MSIGKAIINSQESFFKFKAMKSFRTKIGVAVSSYIQEKTKEIMCDANASNLGYALFINSLYLARFMIYVYLTSVILISIGMSIYLVVCILFGL